MKHRRRISKIFLLAIFAISLFSVAVAFGGEVAAQGDTFGIQPVQESIGLAGGDIRTIAARIIRAILGILGIIAVGIVLYGGFVYMTAAGSEEKITTARRILTNGVIGLAIILSAFAITQFVLSKLQGAINPSAGDVTGSEPSPSVCDIASSDYNPEQCNALCAIHPDYSVCKDAAAFYVKSITPSTPEANNATGMNNVVIRVLFSQPIAPNTEITKSIKLHKTGEDMALPVTVMLVEGGRVLQAAYMNETKTVSPLVAGENYTVEVNKDIKNIKGNDLMINYSFGGKQYPITATFFPDKEFKDEVKPNIAPLTINGQGGNGLTLKLGDTFNIATVISDRNAAVKFGGVGLAKISIVDEETGEVVFDSYDAPAIKPGSSPDYSFFYKNVVHSSLFSALHTYQATLTAYDIDNNSSSVSAKFTVYGITCGNGKQDGDETGVDTGGSCGAGEGGSCKKVADCAKGFACVQNKCTVSPYIEDVDPMNGAEGNWITVLGTNFGIKSGQVEFAEDKNGNKVFDNNEWTSALIVQCDGASSWNKNSVVVKVPSVGAGEIDKAATFTKSAIRLTQGDNPALFDTTINDFGPKPGGDGLFTKNDTKRPGLCKVGVAENFDNIKIGDKVVSLLKGATAAPPKTPVKAFGFGFGSSQGSLNNIYFGGIAGVVNKYSWTETEIGSEVPANLDSGDIGVYVKVGNEKSNGVKFKVLSGKDVQQLPQIASIDPASSTPKSFITISGKGFGNQVGQVFAADSPAHVASCSGNSAHSSCVAFNVASLPIQCVDTWSDSEIVAEVPDGTAAGTYYLIVKNTLGLSSDGQDLFQVIIGAPSPSICRLIPNQGPAPLPAGHPGLNIYGVNFSAKPLVYYWRSGAKPEDPNTWLSSDKDFVNGVSPVTKASETEIATLLPISATDGKSMATGQIKVKSSTGAYSNGVTYNVTSCLGAGELPGFQCCSVGPDKGFWKKKEHQCAGETRKAGYVWRFASGLIPDLPEVVDSCKEGEFPSPTPRKKASLADSACLNASVAARFSLPMEQSSFFGGGVKIFACATGAGGAIDCEKSKKDMTDEKLFAYESQVLKIREYPNAPLLATNTWYHVELTTKIASHQTKTVLGKSEVIKQPLVATKPCGAGTAYCFDFKTGEGLCTLVNAYINPPKYISNKLGVLEDPGWLGVSEVSLWPDKPANPFYYYVWGSANQECIALNVDQYDWQWSPAIGQAQADLARAYKDAGNGNVNKRAVVEARAHTAPDNVKITASADVPNDKGSVKFSPTSTLTIDLADPAVLYYEPSCVEACVNTAIRVKFNRQMSSTTFATGFKLYECLDNSTECKQKSDISNLYSVEPDSESPTDSLIGSLVEQMSVLKADQYYQIILNEKGTPVGDLIKALTKIDPIFYGAILPETKLPFKTRKNAALCLPATIKVSPHPYTASIVGERQAFTAQPYSSPDSCSKFGQPLNKWSYTYDWSSNDPAGVAKVVSSFNTGYGFKSYCGVSCLPKGSQVQSDNPLKDQSLCGDGKVGVGEDCEVGEAGCTLRCLFATQKTGSGPAPAGAPLEVGKSYCGDGVVTTGEACDVAIDKGCTANCLHTGTPLEAFWCENKATAEQKKSTECLSSISVCGNGKLDPGEECEIGKNGATAQTCDTRCLVKDACGTPVFQCHAGTSGCKSDCTFAGASLAYTPPSLCGDGQVGVGESSLCEIGMDVVPIGSGPTQLVEAVGQGSANESGLQQTKVKAELQSKIKLTGVADYNLQCGYSEFKEKTNNVFNDCPKNSDNILGVGKNSCCRTRPARDSELPVDGAGFGGPGVCRNAYIDAVFQVELENISFLNNVELLHGYTGVVNCADKGGVAMDKAVIDQFIQVSSPPQSFALRLWRSIKQLISRLFGGQVGASAVTDAVKAAGIGTWCAGEVAVNAIGKTLNENGVTTTHAVIGVGDILAPDSIYAVLLKGGQNGITDKFGVGIGSKDYQNTQGDIWFFKTGDDVCKLSEVSVIPDAQLFAHPKEQHQFLSATKSVEGQAIQPTAGYSWSWEWKPANHLVFEIPVAGTPNHEDTVSIASREVEGEIKGVLEAKVTVDTTTKNNQLGKVFSDTFDLVALFCANPWPATPQYPFKDNKYNFSMSYCGDAGVSGSKLDDLPYLDEPLVFLKSAGDVKSVCSVGGSACVANQDCDKTLYDIPPIGQTKIPAGSGLCLSKDGKPFLPTGAALLCFEANQCVWSKDDYDLIGEIADDVEVKGAYAYVLTKNGLKIFDVSNSVQPKLSGSVVIQGMYHYAVVLFGNFAFIASHDAGVQIVDVANPQNPIVVGSVKPTAMAFDVALAGTTLAVASGQNTVGLVDISESGKPKVIGALDVKDKPVVTVAGNGTRIAAAVQGSFGYLIDVTNPKAATLVGKFSAPDIISDMELSSSHIFASSIGNNGAVSVIDMKSLSSVITVDDVGSTKTLELSGNTLYAGGDSDSLVKIDISNPEFPAKKTSYKMFDVKSLIAITEIGDFVYLLSSNAASKTASVLRIFNRAAFEQGISCSINLESGWKNICKPIGAQLITPEVLSADTLKRYLFFNPQNEDAIGVQIFKNDKASVTDWYLDKFETLGSMKSTSVAGYEALTDGNNYYVNATNYVAGVTPVTDKMYNNVYLFSINPNAQKATRDVFAKLLASLSFNINLTDHGYCVKDGVIGFDETGKTSARTEPNQYADVKCSTDFDCRGVDGTPISSTNGYCSNVKTKLFRDLDRLDGIEQALGKLDTYFATTKGTLSFKGDLKSGTFAPGYTVSRWPSWGMLGGLVGGLQVDPLNRWTSCSASDSQTCWDAEKAMYACPKFKSVYEYEYVSSTGQYVFHAPLEFFVKNDDLVSSKLADADFSAFSAEPWLGCSGSAYNPFGEKCGDGILNPGEQCEPPGTIAVSSIGTIPAKLGKCEGWTDRSCATDIECGYRKKLGDLTLHSFKESVCVNEFGKYVVDYDTSLELKEDILFGCQTTADCKNLSLYGAGQVGVDPFSGPQGILTHDKFVEYFNKNGDKFACAPLNQDVGILECDGYESAGTAACAIGSIASRLCTNSCKWEYGLCKATSKCDNGVVENGEMCDDGASLNGTYGHCGDDCKSFSVEYCGNGKIDFKDKNNNGKIDIGEPLEFCESGLNGFASGNYAVEKAKSCAWDCQGYGAYCGDKVAQSDKGEECDDGNTADKDGCSSSCQLDGLVCKSAAPAVSVLDSGNGMETRIEVVNGGSPVAVCVDKINMSEVCAAYGLPCVSLKQTFENNSITNLSCASPEAGSPIKDLLDSAALEAVVVCKGQAVASASDIAGAGKCGNGIVEPSKEEVCDLGDQNGKACVPSYSKSCAYCSVDCKKVLTVDPVAFCGNGKVDQIGTANGAPVFEKCDTSGAQVIAPADNGSGPGNAVSCAPDKGSYQCLEQCTTLKNKCVACGFFSDKPKTTLALYNPMNNIDPYKYYYTVELLDSVSYFKNSKKDDGSIAGLTFLTSSDSSTVVDNNNSGLETSQLCNGEYSVMFNQKKLQGGDINTPQKIWKAGKADLFDFPVNGEVGEVKNELVYSPAVPEGVFRVVVKWTKAEADAGAAFQGLVYNEQFSQATKDPKDKEEDIVSYMMRKQTNTLCNDIKKKIWYGVDYWYPTAKDGQKCPEFQGWLGVYAHDMLSAQKTFIQSFTIDTQKPPGGILPEKPYAFFVQAIDNLIWNYRLSNLEVQVYGYHSQQDPLTSIYGPRKTFKIKDAAGTSSNPLVKYWHVFNLVKEGDKYEIRSIANTDSGTGQITTYSDGTLETDFCQVLANIPGAITCKL